MLLSGRHNIANFMAAIALSFEKCENEDIISLAKQFKGLPHRCELVGCVSGIKYINSSIDTTPKRTLSTLNSINGRVILLLGGRSKGLDFSTFSEEVSKKALAVILFGEARTQIYEGLIKCKALKESGIPILSYERFSEALCHIDEIARQGDTVLLSPAATSYDEFQSFEERGELFKKFAEEKARKLKGN